MQFDLWIFYLEIDQIIQIGQISKFCNINLIFMGEILSFLTMRTVIIFIATTFSILVVMLTLNIVTVDEVAVILNMSPEAANAFKLVISRIQEVTGNILDITSQLFNKLFSWAGVDVDLNKIKIDVGSAPVDANHGATQNGQAPATRTAPPANYPVDKDATYDYKAF